jgi:hypothetical protein
MWPVIICIELPEIDSDLKPMENQIQTCEKYRASKSCDHDHVIKLYLRNLRSALRAF